VTSGSEGRQAIARDVQRVIRDVSDFPKPGILFKDITPVLADAKLFARVTEAMAAPFRADGITAVVAIESRGFLLGAPVAQHLGAGLVPMRKPGKLPWKTLREEYALEYGTDCLEMHLDALDSRSRVLIVDDVLATGGTARAACALAGRHAGEVVGCSFLLALGFLGGAEALASRRVEVVLEV
jgi:adenine phosphoribosyltransferase